METPRQQASSLWEGEGVMSKKNERRLIELKGEVSEQNVADKA
jgi:hypothetical protein